MTPELVLMCGVAGAGKSTWRAENLDATHVVVSKDLMPRSARKQPRQDREIRAAIGAGASVVVDNTHLTPADRAPLIALAAELGVACRAVIVVASLEASFERNAQRPGRARVPDGILRQMASRWEAPTMAEGFVSVTQVASDDEAASQRLDRGDAAVHAPRPAPYR